MLGFDAIGGAPIAAGPAPAVPAVTLEGGDVVVLVHRSTLVELPARSASWCIAARPTAATLEARPSTITLGFRPTICEVQP
jgi:hypothetical protein